MLKNIKIIFISHSSKGNNLIYYKKGSDELFVASWAGLFARRLKKYKSELDISSWIMEPFVSKKENRTVYGLNGIIWPYRFVFIRNVMTLSMYFTLLRLSLKHKIILHYNSVFDSFVLLRFLLPPNIKIILSHHGGIPPVKISLKHIIFMLTYRYINAITYLTPSVKKYLLNIGVNKRKLFFLPVGADFSLFTPQNKTEARRLLNLEENKIYGIYVGKFYSLKSVDLILKAYYELRKKYNFSIIFVGGNNDEGNDLYNEVKESGCPYFGFQKYTDMPLFYNAADFYIHPAFNPDFGGLDVSWMEALACNKPVLSPQLAYLDFDYSELGICLNNKEELIEKTEFMINNFRKFNRCREISQMHLDGNSAIMKKILTIYGL